MVHVLQTTQNLVTSRCCFAEDGKDGNQCTQNFNALAQPFFCSFNLLFRDVAVAVVVFLNLLMSVCKKPQFLSFQNVITSVKFYAVCMFTQSLENIFLLWVVTSLLLILNHFLLRMATELLLHLFQGTWQMFSKLHLECERILYKKTIIIA